MNTPHRGRRAAAFALTATLSALALAPALPSYAGETPARENVEFTSVTTAKTLGLPTANLRNALSTPAPTPGRISGANRIETAVAISRHAFATRTAKTVYLARMDHFADALAGGGLTDGPVLLVPTTGPVPEVVLAEIRRVAPGHVVALGGPAAVSDAVLNRAAQGRPAARVAGSNRFDTAALISKRAFPGGAAEAYLATAKKSSPDAVVGGVLSVGPVLPIPTSGPIPSSIRAELARLSPRVVYALGGSSAVPNTALTSAANGAAAKRIAGVNRYDTAAAIARHAFPTGARTAYLARGDVFADAVAGGALTDGPIVLVPPASLQAPASASLLDPATRALSALRVNSVASLGGEGAVSTRTATSVLTLVPSIATSGPVVEVTGSAPAPTASSPPAAGPPTSGVTSLPQRYSYPLPQTTTRYCGKAINLRWPIELPSGYTISCVTGDIPGQKLDTLGLTTTNISYYTRTDGTRYGEEATGTIEIRDDLSDALTEVVIVHELAHAYSYAMTSFAQRDAFAAGLPARYPTFNDPSASYETAPAEVWANSQGTCAGYAPPDNRNKVACSVLTPYIPRWKPTSNLPR